MNKKNNKKKKEDKSLDLKKEIREQFENLIKMIRMKNGNPEPNFTNYNKNYH